MLLLGNSMTTAPFGMSNLAGFLDWVYLMPLSACKLCYCKHSRLRINVPQAAQTVSQLQQIIHDAHPTCHTGVRIARRVCHAPAQSSTDECRPDPIAGRSEPLMSQEIMDSLLL